MVATIETSRSAVVEPRVLTFLFTDLVDSTRLMVRIGETRMEALRQSHFDVLRHEIAAWNGHEVKNLGDGLMVIFASPSDAISCAAAMQRAVDRRNRTHQDPLAIRIGIDTGESSHDGGDWFGGPVVQAKRLCDAAPTSAILVSDLARMLAASRAAHHFGEAVSLQLKGLPQPVTAYQVDWRTTSSPDLPLPPALTAGEAQRTRFVGRSAECRRLLESFARVASGTRRLAVVAGEPGIGKTRVALEMALHVRANQGVVLWGRASEDVRVPYEPLVEALRHYVTFMPIDELREQVGEDAAVLARIVPELLNRLPGLQAATGDDTETERLRLFNAVSALLTEISAGAPSLLVLDDLHWADRATLLLLRRLLRRDAGGDLLILGTFRDTEVPRSHPLAGLLADLGREGLCDRLVLRGLDDPDIAALVESMAGWSPTAQFVQALQWETKGNALYLEEMVRHLKDTGAVTETGLTDTADDGVASAGVPETVKEVLWRRIRRLPTETVDLLKVASVIGQDFGTDLLAALMPPLAGRIVPLLDHAVTSRLLEENPGRLGSYRFSHALVQHALQEEHTHNRRAWIHARIGEALEQLHADDLSPYYAELAHHYACSGRVLTAKVVDFARAATERALAMLAYEDAQTECLTALHALEVCRPDDHAARAELLVLLGTTQLRTGDAPGARESFAEAAAQAKRVGAARTMATAALGYGSLAGFGGVWNTFAEVDETLVGMLEDALGAGDGIDDALRARVLGRLAQALYWSDEKQRMRDLSAQSLELANGSGDGTALAYALDSRHVALWDLDHIIEREPLAEVMLGLGKRHQDRDIQLEAYAWLITDLLELGQVTRVRAHIEEHAAIAEELRQPYHLWYTAAVRAMLAHLEGRYDDMERLVEEAWRHGETAHGANARQTYLVQSLFLRIQRGRLDDFIEGLEAHVEQSPLVNGWRAALTTAYAAMGREDDARRQLQRLGGDGFTHIPRDCIWFGVMAMLGDAIIRFDVREHAAPLYNLLLPYEERVIVVGGAVLCFGPVSLYLGGLARVLGDTEHARLYLERAVGECERLGAPPLVARARAELDRLASGST